MQAVVDWAGPTDLWSLYGQITDPRAGPSRLLGGVVHDHKDKALKASPITYASNHAAPFFIVHGDKDNLVPIAQSRRLAESLRQAGVEVTLRTLAGVGHGGPEFFSGETRELTEAFLDKHLRPASRAKPSGSTSATPAPPFASSSICGGPLRSATGFFRVEAAGDTWWLVDPNGQPTLSIGPTTFAGTGTAARRWAYAPYGRNTRGEVRQSRRLGRRGRFGD